MNILTRIYRQVSEELGIPEDKVKFAYESMWMFIKEKVEGMPLKTMENLEDFRNMRTSFNIPSVGKLSCTYDRFRALRETYDLRNKLKKEYERNKTDEDDSADSQQDCHNG